MILREIIELLEAEIILCDEEQLNIEVTKACACDLMSDILSFTEPGSFLLTGLANLQTIYTAQMADIICVCFVRGKKPDKKMLELAKSQNLPLLSTKLTMYESCGRLYEMGLHRSFSHIKK